eukprot:2628566-Pyramimonas_sp.AAC.1
MAADRSHESQEEGHDGQVKQYPSPHRHISDAGRGAVRRSEQAGRLPGRVGGAAAGRGGGDAGRRGRPAWARAAAAAWALWCASGYGARCSAVAHPTATASRIPAAAAVVSNRGDDAADDDAHGAAGQADGHGHVGDGVYRGGVGCCSAWRQRWDGAPGRARGRGSSAADAAAR